MKSLDKNSCCTFRKNLNLIISTDLDEVKLQVYVQKDLKNIDH